MKLDTFTLEAWMTAYEKDYIYNLAESCVAPLTIKDIASYFEHPEEILNTIYNSKLDYGPIEGSKKLRTGILALYETGDIDNIAVCHGCISANEMVLTSLLEANDHIITIQPTYQQLYSLPKSFGVEVSFVTLQKEKHWIPEVSEFEALITDNTKMICLTSPNNPTGTSFPKTVLEELVILAKKYDLYIFIDEAYRGASLEKEVAISDLYEKGISTGGMSKTIGVPGLRIGWIKGPKDIIIEINNRKDYHMISNGFIYDYVASLIFEKYSEIQQRALAICTANRQVLKEWLQQEPLVSCHIPTTGTIAFLEYHLNIPSKELCIQLQQDTGVFFVPGACFGVENHLRFGMANETKIVEKGLQVFSTWLHQQKEIIK